MPVTDTSGSPFRTFVARRILNRQERHPWPTRGQRRSTTGGEELLELDHPRACAEQRVERAIGRRAGVTTLEHTLHYTMSARRVGGSRRRNCLRSQSAESYKTISEWSSCSRSSGPGTAGIMRTRPALKPVPKRAVTLRRRATGVKYFSGMPIVLGELMKNGA